MGQLQDRMIQKLKVLGYSEKTQKLYIDQMKRFVAFHNISPDKLSREDIYTWQVHLVEELKVSYSTFKIAVSAIRFFYNKVLDRHWFIKYIPYQKKENFSLQY